MKILLVQPFKNFGLNGESYPPIGLGYLATALKDHDVHIFDCLEYNFNYDAYANNLMDLQPDLIGFTLYSISVPYVESMVRVSKAVFPEVKIVLGGPHPSALPEKVLLQIPDADYAVQGEGEIPLRELANGRPLNEIKGLIYRDNGIKINPPYFPENIEEYGSPDYEKLNIEKYFDYLTFHGRGVPVFLSRGCPFNCTFCSAKVVSGRRLRRRSLDHIFKELRHLQEKYKVKRFIIQDEGFGVDKDFIEKFCRRVKIENFKAKFYLILGMRLDIVDRELLNLMKEAGIEKRIALGIESGSNRILHLMNKRTNIEMIKEKVNLMKDAGFEPTGYFIIGYPTETKEEIEETVKLALSLPIKEASFTAFQPLPATDATDSLIKSGEIPEDYDFSVTEQNSVVYAPKGMTLEELEKIRKNAIKRFYLRPRILFHHLGSMDIFVFSIKKVFAIWGNK